MIPTRPSSYRRLAQYFAVAHVPRYGRTLYWATEVAIALGLVDVEQGTWTRQRTTTLADLRQVGGKQASAALTRLKMMVRALGRSVLFQLNCAKDHRVHLGLQKKYIMQSLYQRNTYHRAE